MRKLFPWIACAFVLGCSDPVEQQIGSNLNFSENTLGLASSILFLPRPSDCKYASSLTVGENGLKLIFVFGEPPLNKQFDLSEPFPFNSANESGLSRREYSLSARVTLPLDSGADMKMSEASLEFLESKASLIHVKFSISVRVNEETRRAVGEVVALSERVVCPQVE